MQPGLWQWAWSWIMVLFAVLIVTAIAAGIFFAARALARSFFTGTGAFNEIPKIVITWGGGLLAIFFFLFVGAPAFGSCAQMPAPNIPVSIVPPTGNYQPVYNKPGGQQQVPSGQSVNTNTTYSSTTGQPAANKWYQDVTLNATDSTGQVITLPHAGSYEFQIISGSYNTGTAIRSVVAVLVGAYAAQPDPTQYNQPKADFWVGDWSDGNAGTPVKKQINSNQIRLMTVDDMGSYAKGNFGSVTIRVTDITP